VPSAEACGVPLKGEPPCRYTIISEHSPSRGTATTWVKGEDGYLYRCCIRSFDGRRVWSRFPPEFEPPVPVAAPRSAKAVRTSVRSPWQNGVAERWVGSCRREMLDHIIPLSETHLLRLGHEYIRYYHEDRTHIGLHKETPAGRLIESRPSRSSRVRALPRIGGLQHRYTWSAAA